MDECFGDAHCVRVSSPFLFSSEVITEPCCSNKEQTGGGASESQKEILIPSTVSMSLEDIVLSDISQTQKDKY